MDTLEKIRMMFDDQSSTILRLTSQNPRTASQLCQALHIPRSVCYRKLKVLINERLLDVDKPMGNWGSKGHATKYVSNIDTAYVALEHGEMRMVLKLKNDNHPQTTRISTEYNM